MSSLENYSATLEELESDRSRVYRDRQALTFAGALSFGLGILATAGLFLNPNFLMLAMVFLLLGLGLSCFIAASSMDQDYQRKFRALFTRRWVHDIFPEVFFTQNERAPLFLDPKLSAEMGLVLKKKSNQFRVTENILFDNDPYNTSVYVVESRSKMKTDRCDLVWFMPSISDQMGFVRVGQSLLEGVQIREFGTANSNRRENVLRAFTTAKQKLLRKRKIALACSESGVWLSVQGVRMPFKAPIESSCLNKNSYNSWPVDAKLPFAPELRSLMSELR